jgi:hypothetical protein
MCRTCCLKFTSLCRMRSHARDLHDEVGVINEQMDRGIAHFQRLDYDKACGITG